MMATTARTNSMLKMLEPMTLPTTMSASFLRAATIDVASSGNDVPSATIVKPIISGLMPSNRAPSTAA